MEEPVEIKRKPSSGTIIKIKVDNYHVYGQVLDHYSLVIFDSKNFKFKKQLEEILNLNFLFIVAVYRNAYSSSKWEKVGKLEVHKDLKVLPKQFIQDIADPNDIKIYDPKTGASKNSSKQECENLERCAVWQYQHIEERIVSHYSGRNSQILESLKMK